MPVQLPDGLSKVLEEYPIEAGVKVAYGTAGFRTVGERIPPIAARMGALIYLKAATTADDFVLGASRRMGVMITASHNHHVDNGLKVVDLDGGMLNVAWEPHCAAVANANSSEEYAAALQGVGESLPKCAAPMAAGFPALSADQLTVIIGCDTRTTSPTVVAALKAALDAFKITYVDMGKVTTPVVHHHVYYGAAAAPWAATIADSFAGLVTDAPSTAGTAKRQIVVDCANGVGGVGFKEVLDALKERHPAVAEQFCFTLANTDAENKKQLNENCGADFSQKNRCPAVTLHAASAAAFEAAGKSEAALGVYAVDGDADRVVGFECVDAATGAIMPAGQGLLLDGDRIIVLIAMALKAMIRDSGLADVLGDFSIGVVQTAYANGGSAKFIVDTLNLPSVIAATGVKHVHHDATLYDIGIYFEANGHGTMLVDDVTRHPPSEKRDARLLARLKSIANSAENTAAIRVAATEVLRFGTLLSQSCGDGIANIFAIEYCLRRLGLTFKSWLDLYDDLPSKQIKVTSSDHQVVKTVKNETKATAPGGMQAAIDEAVATAGGSLGRSFVRPSGTEPIIRVYAEAKATAECDALTDAVIAIVNKFAP